MKIKNLLIAFIALTAIVNFSCSKDDDNTNSVSLVGTWEEVSNHVKGTTTSTSEASVKTRNIDTTTTIDLPDYHRMIFKADGTYYLDSTIDGNKDIKGTYKTNGNKITVNDGEESTAIFSINGNTLIITSEDEESYTSGTGINKTTHVTKTIDISTFKRIN